MTYTHNRNSAPRGVFARRLQEHPLAFLSELERQFAQFTETPKPAGVEIHDAGEKYIIIAEAVGIESDKIDIEVLGKNIHITGSNNVENSNNVEKATTDSAEDTQNSENSAESLVANDWKIKPRSINYELQVPENIIAEEVTAELALGLLTVMAPKLPIVQGKKVTVNNKEK